MFTKSKKEAGAEKAKPAKTKPAKAAKAKVTKSPKSDGNFLSKHIEKLILGLVVGLMGYMVFDGLRVKSYPGNKNPDDLSKQSTQVLNQVRDQDHWAAIAPERTVESNYLALSKGARKKTPAGDDIPMLDTPAVQVGLERPDPTLAVAMNIEGATVYGAIKIQTRDKENPLDAFKDAPPLQQPKRNERNNNNSNPYGNAGSDAGAGGDMYGGAMGGDMYGGGLGGAGAGTRRLDPKYDRGVGGTMGGAGDMYGGGMGAEGGMGSDMYGGGAMGGDMYGSGMGGQGAATGPKKPTFDRVKPILFNAITAVVPHDQQVTAFKDALEFTTGYNATRDTPRYEGFEVQRVDVTDNPTKDIAENEWQDLPNASSEAIQKLFDPRNAVGSPTNIKNTIKTSWSGKGQEVVYQNYSHPNLSMSIPPMLLRDYRSWARNSMTPAIGETIPPDKRKSEMELDPAPGYGGGMYGGMGGDMYGGMGGGGMSGDMYGGSMGGDMYGGGMGGDMYGGGMGGMAGKNPNVGLPVTPGKYKLVRFYDLEAKVGRDYRYRIRILYNDPNYPDNMMLSPPLKTIKQEAMIRVRQLMESDKERNAKAKLDWEKDKATQDKPFIPTRSFKRASDWSAASKVIHTTFPATIALGPPTDIGATVGELPKVGQYITGPKAKLAYAEFEPKFAIEVARYDDVFRGAVVAGQWKVSGKEKAIEFVNPLNRSFLIWESKDKEGTKDKIMNLPKFAFRGSVAVLDVRASEPLGYNDRKDPLGTALEIISVNGLGEISVNDEFSDFDKFRMYTNAKEWEVINKAGSSAAGAGGSDGMYGSGGPGSEGGKGG